MNSNCTEQQASGIFTYLHSNILSVFSGAESTNDLRPEVLIILATLTLAQAQDVFVKKAMKGLFVVQHFV